MGYKIDSCFCCSLRAGTITFGVLSFVGCLSELLIGLVGYLVEPDNLTEEGKDALKMVSLFVILISLLCGILSMLFLCGAIGKRTGILKAWIVILEIGIVIDVIMLISIPFRNSKTSEQKIEEFFKVVFGLVITAFELFVVHSYRQQILRESESDPLPHVEYASVVPVFDITHADNVGALNK